MDCIESKSKTYYNRNIFNGGSLFEVQINIDDLTTENQIEGFISLSDNNDTARINLDTITINEETEAAQDYATTARKNVFVFDRMIEQLTEIKEQYIKITEPK